MALSSIEAFLYIIHKVDFPGKTGRVDLAALPNSNRRFWPVRSSNLFYTKLTHREMRTESDVSWHSRQNNPKSFHEVRTMPNDDKTKQDFETHRRLRKKFPAWIEALLVLTALLAAGFSFVSCKSDGTVVRDKVTVGISKSFTSVPVYVAQKKGFFSDEGLDVTLKEYSSGKKATNALLIGEVDISTLADIPVIFNSLRERIFVFLLRRPIHIVQLR